MICPVCKGTIGFSKVTEVSGPVDLKRLDDNTAAEKIGDTATFFNKNDYVILCNNCNNKGREVEMEEEYK